MSQTSAPTPTYRLADHVRACRIDQQVILLDLIRSKYLGIGREQQLGLSQAIADWPATPEPMSTPSPRVGLDALLKPLVDQQMLVRADTSPRPSTSLAAPAKSLDVSQAGRPSLKTRDFVGLAWAASIAGIWLKRRNLADIAVSVHRLRPNTTSGNASNSADQLGRAVASYLRLRPFLFTAHDRCLHDSLTLVRFLARKHIYATWVIGVRTRPFAAHSWVQAGDLVINDVHEHVRRFTPILIV